MYTLRTYEVTHLHALLWNKEHCTPVAQQPLANTHILCRRKEASGLLHPHGIDVPQSSHLEGRCMIGSQTWRYRCCATIQDLCNAMMLPRTFPPFPSYLSSYTS